MSMTKVEDLIKMLEQDYKPNELVEFMLISEEDFEDEDGKQLSSEVILAIRKEKENTIDRIIGESVMAILDEMVGLGDDDVE